MSDFVHWVERTQISQFVQNIEWVIPTVQCIHILGVAIILSSVVMIVLRLMGWADVRSSIAVSTARYVSWIWGAALAMFLTGSILIIGEPRRELMNIAFQIKMVLVLCAVGIIATFQRSTVRRPSHWNHEPLRTRIKLLAVGVLLLFFAIAIAGRWIAYMSTDYSSA